jgi:cell shape-determining protein MreD
MLSGDESAVWQVWKRRLIVFTLLVSVLCLTVLPIWQKIGVQPTLLLIVIYHLSVYRSDLLSIEQLVLTSLILDGIYAYPLGFSALRLLIDYLLLLTQKRILYHQRFHWVWAGFSVFVVIDAFIFAILLSFVKHEWAGILTLTPGILLTIALYPPLVLALNRLIVKRLQN